MKRRLYGDDSREVAESERDLITLAAIVMSRAESVQVAQHSLALTRRFYGPDSVQTADSLASMALVYEQNGQSHSAERVLREAVTIYKKVEADSADLGQILVRLSRSLNDLGRYPEAESRAREALAIYDKRHLGDHLRVLNAHSPLVIALQGEGKLDEAERVSNDMAAMSRRLFPNGMTRLAFYQREHASVLRSQGRFGDAAAMVQEACEWVKVNPGPESAQYANCLADLAHTRVGQGRPGDAESLYRESLPKLRKALGDGSATVAWIELDFADTLSQQQKINEVEQLFRDRIAVYRRDPANEENLRIMLAGAADWESSMGRGQEAETHAREALKIGGNVLEAEDSQFVEMNSILGAALSAQKRFREAEPVLLGAYGKRQDIPALEKDARKKIVERIVAMYQAWDRADPSAGKAAETQRWRSLI
jgi:tetratricopeptide (TPR) repeat protein